MTNIKQKKVVSELSLSEEILTDINLDSLNLNGDYLPLSGGTINGNINIINGNFVQTTDDYTKAYGRNSFIQAETVLKDDGITPKYQHSSSGTKGFVILGINNDTKSIKLSGDISELSNHINSTSFSFSLKQSSMVDAFKITNVEYTSNDFGFISVDVWPNNSYFIGSTNTPESEFLKWYEFDDNGLFAMSDSSIGNTVLENFYGQHAEGGSVKAIGKYSHAEGRRTIAGNRYAHAEGDGCQALGQASHAEGFNTIVEGLYSHAEGYGNKVYKESSHAEGHNNVVGAPYAHAEGYGNNVNAAYSHVEGQSNIINGAMSHAEGSKNTVNAGYSHAEGVSNLAGSQSCLSVLSGDLTNNTITLLSGYTNDLSSYKSTIDTYIKDKTQSNIIYQLVNRYCKSKVVGVDYTTNTLSLDMLETPLTNDGYNTTTKTFNISSVSKPIYKLWFTNISKNGQKIGEKNPNTNIYGTHSHVEGYQTYAFGNYSHAEGYSTIAADDYSHVEGRLTRAGLYSHAEGYSNDALGKYSHAEGYDTYALADYSHSAGCNSIISADHVGAYVWNGQGKPNKANTSYSSNGIGTFNINPTNGTKGFYIGAESLNDILSNLSVMIKTQILNELGK